MIGSFHIVLSLLALLIAFFTIYQAFDIAPRLAASRLGGQRVIWYAVGTWLVGLGIWSQHFVGILARTTRFHAGLDPVLCFISGLLALVIAFTVLRVTDTVVLRFRRLLLGSVVIWICVVPMHFLMVASMHLAMVPHGRIRALWLWCLLPGLLAMFALRVVHAFRRRDSCSPRRRIPAACATALVLMTALHVTMAAAGERFPAGSSADSATVVWVGAVLTLAALLPIGASLCLAELVTRLYRRTRSLAGSLDSLTDRLRHLATHDALTGLPNRTTLVERLERALQEARAGGGHVAVMYIDLDGFKHINDSLGHSMGDQLLCAVAERLSGQLRYGSLARVGGDEFVAVLDHMRTPDSAQRIVARLLAVMQQPFTLAGVELRISSSIGLAHHLQDGDDGETLVAQANVAMYNAKRSGRNGYRLFDTRMREKAERAMAIQRGLLSALDDNSLLLLFQPKHDSRTGAIVGAEALARWHHPVLGCVSPEEFIEVAERSGQIGPIGEWVIREACRQIACWRSRGLQPVRIAINLSPLQLNQPGLVDTAARIVAEAEIEPSAIMFEVTESMAMENAERTTAVLRDFRERGFEFAIDDFGTGYSSLAYLQKFQVRQLKIDRFFVQALDEGGPEARAIIAAIIELAHTLNMEVVAEGVETALQSNLLRMLGCDQVQGYFHSMPMSPAEFEQQYLGLGSGANALETD